MAEIILKHWYLGEIKRIEFNYPHEVKDLIKQWKSLYGLKFKECEVVLENYFIRTIKHIPSAQLFKSIRQAGKAINCSERKVEDHLHKNRFEGFIYEFEYVYKKIKTIN
jgi:hypothetical protein